jgi:hypothetical protein
VKTLRSVLVDFDGALATRRIVQERHLRPHLLVHPKLLAEFEGIALDAPNVVVLWWCWETPGTPSRTRP